MGCRSSLVSVLCHLVTRISAAWLAETTPMVAVRSEAAKERTSAEVVAGTLAAREHAEQTLIFELGRINIWDVAICWWAYQWAVARGVGRPVTLA
jgi:ornithine cyclodeaminase/alanine dehydrogenase-like protein (mu-crystallin family)